MVAVPPPGISRVLLPLDHVDELVRQGLEFLLGTRLARLKVIDFEPERLHLRFPLPEAGA